MRTTKALVCAAAVAAGAVTAMAQSNVYSLNVVGYINTPLVEGFSMVANQLDIDGTGTNNTVDRVFTNSLPVNAKVYVWNGAGYTSSTFAKNKTGTATNWTPIVNVNPGQGFWVQIPTGAFGGGTGTVTTVGTVLQGALVNPYVAPAGGFSLVSSMVPVAGSIDTVLGYKAQATEKVYTWNGASWDSFTYSKNKTGTATNWVPSTPQIGVNQGVWLQTVSGSVWSNNFIVQ